MCCAEGKKNNVFVFSLSQPLTLPPSEWVIRMDTDLGVGNTESQDHTHTHTHTENEGHLRPQLQSATLGYDALQRGQDFLRI